ncbi:MAG: hypothetical protein AAGM40_10320 [Cyanobacteria bacterium J06573_2]
MQVVYTHCAGLDVHKKTVTAIVIAYHLILRNTTYSELGADYFERQQKPQQKKKRLIKQLEKLGYQVSVEPIQTAV